MLQQKGVEASKFHGFAYDGIWVIAKTLTRVMELLRIKQRQNTYHNFTVDDREVGKMVLDVMNETNFYGVTVSTLPFFYRKCLYLLKVVRIPALQLRGFKKKPSTISLTLCVKYSKMFEMGKCQNHI